MNSDDLLRAIGQAIQAQREAGGHSVGEVAQQIGWHPSKLVDVERGEREPTILEFVSLAEALDVSPATLASRL